MKCRALRSGLFSLTLGSLVCSGALLAACDRARTQTTDALRAVEVEPTDHAFTRTCARATQLLDPAPHAELLGPLLDTHDLRTPLEQVMADLNHFCLRSPDGLLTLPMRDAIRRPLALAEISAHTVAPLLTPGSETTLVTPHSTMRQGAQLVCNIFGAPSEPLPPYQGTLAINDPQGAIFALDFLLNQPRLHFEPALANRPSASESLDLLDVLLDGVTLDSKSTERLVSLGQLGRREIDTSERGLMRAVAYSLAHIDAEISSSCDWSRVPHEPLAPEIASAVTGSALAGENVPGVGWVVVGSLANNSYDMNRIAAVFDPGGDDTYTWSALFVGNQAILDRAGNDRYIGGARQGPAAGLFGLSLIDDVCGDDVYLGESFACGAGVFGVGILIDRAGNDRYTATSWSMGVGVFGGGFLFDLRGNDSYVSAFYSQGVGGPLGVGALVDRAGNDLYRADGGGASAYGDATVSFSMSQGIGVGARPLCGGGVGILLDDGGDDRYEGGEFSQGGGYYYGFGMLIDHLGNDLYRGDHFAQGFTAHQAAGVLIDVRGDDCYWSTTSASQGAAWDTATSLLVDGDGNDSYRGGALAQGSAAEQGIAALCDLGGSDHYVGTHSSVQGESSDNAYHFAHSGARSFSVLIDAGDGIDFFSSNRVIHGVTVTGPARRSDLPASAPLFGMAIDLPLVKSRAESR